MRCASSLPIILVLLVFVWLQGCRCSFVVSRFERCLCQIVRCCLHPCAHPCHLLRCVWPMPTVLPFCCIAADLLLLYVTCLLLSVDALTGSIHSSLAIRFVVDFHFSFFLLCLFPFSAHAKLTTRAVKLLLSHPSNWCVRCCLPPLRAVHALHAAALTPRPRIPSTCTNCL